MPRAEAVPGRWASRGACRGDVDSMMMPERAGRYGPTTLARIEVLRERCLTCPVFAECQDWALTSPDPAAGMFAGGMTQRERSRVRRSLVYPEGRHAALRGVQGPMRGF